MASTVANISPWFLILKSLCRFASGEKEFDEALLGAFPGPEPMSVLLVGGACLLLQGITTQPTDSVDVIILEMLGSQERTLVFHSPTADKIRRIIRGIGRRHGLKGERQQFINDDSAPFLLELSEYELPPMRLLRLYARGISTISWPASSCQADPRKMVPILPSCAKRFRSRARLGHSSLWIGTSLPPAHQATYRLPCTLESMFPRVAQRVNEREES